MSECLDGRLGYYVKVGGTVVTNTVELIRSCDSVQVDETALRDRLVLVAPS